MPNNNIYNVNVDTQKDLLNNPRKRLPIFTSWLHSLMYPLQWLRDWFFGTYIYNTTYPDWATATSYNVGDIVKYGYKFYYCIVANTSSSSINPSINTYWYKMQDNFIGLDERSSMTGQKLLMEYALNRYFGVSAFSTVQWDDGIVTQPPYTQIYIKTNNINYGQFWLSNGNGLNSYTGNGQSQRFFLGNSYSINQFSFTIYVPHALISSIAAMQPLGVSATDAIRSIANQYVEIGINYNVTSY